MKMIGNTRIGKNIVCRCCVAPSWKTTNKRAAKRRERQDWKKDLSNM